MVLFVYKKTKQLIIELSGAGDTTSLRFLLVRGAIGSFAVKIASTSLALISSIILARCLGVIEFGYYSFSMAIVGLLTIQTTLGLPNMMVRYIATYQARSQWGLVRGLILRANQAVLFISFIIVVLAGVIVWMFGDSLPAIDRKTFFISLLLLPLIAQTSIMGASLRGLSHAVLGQVSENLLRPGLFIMLIIPTFILFRLAYPNSETAILLQVFTTLIAFIIGIFLLNKRLPQGMKDAKPLFEIKTWFHSAIPLLLVGGLLAINNNIDIIMLGIFKGAGEVGIYQVVTKGALIIPLVLQAVNMVVAPYYSRLYANNEIGKLQKIVTVSTVVIFLLSLPIAIVFIFFGPWVISTFFGQAYISGATALAILSVGQLINAASGTNGTLLNMTGNEKDSARGVLIAVVVNLILNTIFIPKWSITGAALANAISLVIWNLLLLFWVYKRLRIIPLPFLFRH